MKVRITKLPQARTGYQVQGSLVNDVPAMGGADYNAYIGQKPSEVKKTISMWSQLVHLIVLHFVSEFASQIYITLIFISIWNTKIK